MKKKVLETVNPRHVLGFVGSFLSLFDFFYRTSLIYVRKNVYISDQSN